ncbi:hypothetical protein LK542_20435 [Massilia sp. IC2-477]|uniref:hypothetical protein n=1 Tax=unclassified Massilia TaxID=2609279 RepID=UPI001D12A48B|nr:MULTISPECIES: hypothetical protein [unclassified Massilia]MCC2957993.1 hypothetical protein [Massilia sp. IC2-477]MCC2973446.1 hypothetical protein [Massilia sp. IC2-476]
MKFSLIRPAAMLAMALGLASCGGGSDDESYTVAGTVQGLQYSGLVLTNNGEDITVAPPAKAGDDVTFAFSRKLEYGDTYNVTVKTRPDHQSCEILAGNADTAGRLATINARFRCAVIPYAVGGTITGLTKDNTGLVLANGSTTGTLTIAAADTNTTGTAFPYELAAIPFGQTYSVAVITQPKGARCTVANPTGTMGDAAVTNVNVTCVQTGA